MKTSTPLTTLLLVRHAATANNLAHPAKLQGRKANPPLDPVGIHQAKIAAEYLAIRPIHVCYSSPLLRAFQTAQILAEPHLLKPQVIPQLTECDIGDWEGLSWETIREQDPVEYAQYMKNPAEHPYKGGENFQQVLDRVEQVMRELIEKHTGKTILIVSHHIVHRVYLAHVLGLSVSKARNFSLDNASISIVTSQQGKEKVQVLNGNFHLLGIGTAGKG